MTATALDTQGVRLQRGDGGGPEAFTDVGELKSFRGPGGSPKVIDITTLASTFKEKKAGLPDEGQFQFECHLNPANAPQVGLRTDRAARTLRHFKIILTDAGPTTLSFSGYVLGFQITGAQDDVIAVSITIEITGAVTWA